MNIIKAQTSKSSELKKIETIGVLTGGGDCPGLNAVIRAVTKSATLTHNWKVKGILDGFDGLIFKRTKNLAFDDVRGIISKGGTILGSTNKGNPFKYKTKIRGKIKIENLSEKVIENIDKLNLDALVVIGGDGTLSIAHEFSKMGVPVVGVPKTIDNDLCCTDQTFGFDTAVNTAVEAMDKIRTTAESHHRVMLVEVMGRTTGWIAIHSGIASGADLILIPEIPYEPENVFEVIKARMKKKRTYSIVVVAEGAKPKGGSEVIKMRLTDSEETARLGGVSAQLAKQLMDNIGASTRATILGHVQRGGAPSSFDRVLGTRLGYHAVEMIASGDFGNMAALKGTSVKSAPLAQATKSLKKVDPEGDLVACAKNLGVSFGI